jgi:hypothetical protein
MRTITVLLLLAIGCLVPLVLGMEAILLLSLPGGLPLGTLMAAVAMISASLIPVVKGHSGSMIRLAGWVLFWHLYCGFPWVSFCQAMRL